MKYKANPTAKIIGIAILANPANAPLSPFCDFNFKSPYKLLLLIELKVFIYSKI
jgi:hypothetical protein